MPDNIQPLVYRTPQSRRLRLMLVNFTGLVLVSLLMGLIFGYRLSLLACFVIALIMYASTGQTITLYADRLMQKIPLCRPREFLFTDGVFSLQEITGIEAWLLSLRSRCAILKHTSDLTGRKISLGILMPEANIREIYQKIQAAQPLQSDSPP